MTHRFRPLETATVPLSGIRLIEAGAGTGKTTTISGLYLRLILEKRLLPENILVVTFTRAATAELKERIRQTLIVAKNTLSGGKPDESPAARLAEPYIANPDALIWIQDALANLDQAAIFTIHGFCQRVLTEFAFETRTPFETELVTDAHALLKAVAEDYWRCHFYDAPPEFLAYCRNRLSGPDDLSALLSSCRIPLIHILPGCLSPGPMDPAPFRHALGRLKETWRGHRGEVLERLKSPVLSAVKYGKSDGVAGDEESPRAIRIFALAEEMDRYLSAAGVGFPMPKGMEKFSAGYVRGATKKNHEPPSHHFFEECDELIQAAEALKETMDQTLLAVRRRFLDEAPVALERKKAAGALQLYDDLLTGVRRALDGPWAAALVQSVSHRYQAALVDEFQDTDRLQYDIFSRLFSSETATLFLIGDPKQAIYGFRGADIFTYMQAASKTDLRYTLTDNWRSTPPMIAATNALFSGHRAPFIFEGIPFHAARPGLWQGRDPGTDFSSEPAMHLWVFPGDEKNGKSKPVPKSEAVVRIAGAVADEIAELLDPEIRPQIGEKKPPVNAGAIAVLVRTNRQAGIIKNALMERRVPSVLFHSVHLFDTREAVEMQTVLSAIAAPSSDVRFRAALATDLFGIPSNAFELTVPPPSWWEPRLERFHEYRRIWLEKGFMPMFHSFLAEEKIRPRLIGLGDGERRLTNVLHLAEILHRTAAERHLGMNGLLKWFNENMDPSAPRSQEELLRLESDEDAVKIVTIHKSKGLEYDIVFCPFCWEGVQPPKGDVTFHDPGNDGQLTVDIGSVDWEQHANLAAGEQLAEDIRLLYVAVTRSRQRCYLAWGDLNTADTSAMAYLFHFQNTPRGLDTMVSQLKRQMADRDESERMQDLDAIAKRSGGAVVVEKKDHFGSRPMRIRSQAIEPLAVKKFSGKIQLPWRITSYSALASPVGMEEVMPDRDVSTGERAVGADGVDRWDEEMIELKDFPKGARAGNFFHEVLENLSFQDAATVDADSRSRLEALVADGLKAHGFGNDWLPSICRLFKNLSKLPLGEDGDPWMLADVEEKSRIHEMGFHFPVRRQRYRTINRIFEKYGTAGRPFPDTGDLSETTILPGYLKGYIDLVFRARGRYYVLDWKSNHLGDSYADYRAARLVRVMEEEQYLLQYYLYVVALDRYLRSRIPAYRYETHFGGVLYVFLRGVSVKKGNTYGIYRDCPPAGLIGELQRALTSS